MPVLTIEETRFSDWVIKLDGKLYSGPYCFHGAALGMASKLGPLAGADVDPTPVKFENRATTNRR